MSVQSGFPQPGFPHSSVPMVNPQTGVVNTAWYLFFSSISALNSSRMFAIIDAATYMVGANDIFLIANFVGGTVTLTLPDAGSNPVRSITIKTVQNHTVVSDAANVAPLAGGVPGTALLSGTAGQWAIIASNGVNWKIMAAN